MAKAVQKISTYRCTVKVHFNGEAGIDTGAMSQEFLAEVISDMGKEMFPDESPSLHIMFKMAPSAPVVRL